MAMPERADIDEWDERDEREEITLSVVLNGELRHVPAGSTVAALLAELGRHPRTVAVELNGDILPRDGYAARQLSEGDRLEVVHFVQGG